MEKTTQDAAVRGVAGFVLSGAVIVSAFAALSAAVPVHAAGGLVSLSFDDGSHSIYENAIPILDAAGYKSTQYIITSRMGEQFASYMSTEEVADLHRRGHEIGSHSRTHRDLTTLSEEELDEEINGSKSDLNEIGIANVSSFAYPFGTYNDSVAQKIADAGYSSARSTNFGNNITSSLDRYALARKPVDARFSMEEVKGWIDEAQARGEWLILVFHDIENEGGSQATSPEDLREIVEYLQAKNARVLTVSEGLAAMGAGNGGAATPPEEPSPAPGDEGNAEENEVEDSPAQSDDTPDEDTDEKSPNQGMRDEREAEPDDEEDANDSDNDSNESDNEQNGGAEIKLGPLGPLPGASIRLRLPL